MKILPKDVLRVPDRHAFAFQCRNVAYLAGHVHDINPRRMNLMLTNNKNLLLPVLLTPNTQPPRRFSQRSQVKVTCTIRGYMQGDVRAIGIYARGFEMPNILELPVRSSFEKVVPAVAEEITNFKPYGAGFRPTSACNSVEVAGWVSGIRLDRQASTNMEPLESEGLLAQPGEGAVNGKVTILIRQNQHADQAVPVVYYGRFANTIIDRVKVGDPISTRGVYRVRPVPTGEMVDGKHMVTLEPYIHIELPQQCDEHHIRYINDAEEKWPEWVRELRAPRRRRSSARNAETAPENAAPAAAEPVSTKPSERAPASDGTDNDFN